MLSIKNLIFKKKLVRKLTELYVGSYIIEEVVTTLANTVKLRLPALIRIHSMVNTSRLVKYMLWFKDLRVNQWIKPCIGLTQENSIENSV